MHDDKTGSSGHKSEHEKFGLDIRNFFTMRVVKYWNRLPREIMKPLSSELFRSQLDMALSSLI